MASMATKQQHEIIDYREAMGILGVSHQRVYKLIADGILPDIRIGGHCCTLRSACEQRKADQEEGRLPRGGWPAKKVQP